MKNKKIILSLLLVCVLAMPVFAKAITLDEVRAQIASLQAQIAQLVAQLAQIQGNSSAAWCHTFNTNLKIGDGAPSTEVLNLQKALNKSGLYEITMQEDGYFGEQTASAVVGFQEKYRSEILTLWGLAHGTGYVGKTTRAKLNKLYGCSPIACTADAKQCPDGSYVSRSGPKCEFAPCPIQATTPPATCTDSDGGLNNYYYVKGDVTVMVPTNSGGTYPVSYTDTCVDNNVLTEYSCIWKTSTVWGVNSENFNCPNGCSNGACLPMETFSWNLEQGKNLISLPLKPVSNKIADILKPIEGKYQEVKLWDELTKDFIIYGATSSISTMDFAKVYVINMKEPATLTIQGAEWNKTFTEWINSLAIVNGWNAIGYPFIETMPIQSFNVAQPLQNIVYFSPSQGKFLNAYNKIYLTAHSAVNVPDDQKTTLFMPGKGYMGAFYSCSSDTYCQTISGLCIDGYTPKCNADGSNAAYLKGECYCSQP